MPRHKKTTAQVLADFKQAHGDRFNYILAIYKGARHRLTIGCRRCGQLFDQYPFRHSRGDGCRACQHDPLAPSTLYLCRMTHPDCSEPWVKIGVTRKKSVSIRWQYGTKLTAVEIKTWPFAHKKDALKIEQTILARYNDHRQKPGHEFDGKTECFPANLTDRLIDDIERLANAHKVL